MPVIPHFIDKQVKIHLSIFRLLHFSQATTVWDDLIDNLWRHVLAVGVVLAAVAVGFSRLVTVCWSLQRGCYYCQKSLTVFFLNNDEEY